MRGRPKPGLARAARRGAAAALIVVLGVIVYWFIWRRPPRVEGPPATTKESLPPDSKEGVSHLEFKGEMGRIRITADKFSVDKDGLNHLEGNVEVVDYGKTGGRELILTAERISYDKDMIRFDARGKAKIRDRDLVLEAPFFLYNKNTEIFRTNGGASLSTDKLKGYARKLIYSRAKEELDLAGKIRAEFKVEGEPPEPLVVTAPRLIYRRSRRTGHVEGGIKIKRGRSEGAARALEFWLSSDERILRQIILRGRAWARMVGEGKEAGERRIRAEEIRLTSFRDSAQIAILGAKGKSSLSIVAASGSRTGIQAGSQFFFFKPDGELKHFIAEGAAGVKLEDADKKDAKEIHGERIQFNKATEVLNARGKGKSRVRLTSSSSDITAVSLALNLKNENYQAKGTVEAVLRTRPEETALGFFSKDKPVFVTCQEMRHYRGKTRSFFKGEVRIWQEKQMVACQEFQAHTASGQVSGRGEVRTIFSHRPNPEDKEERVEIGAERMAYEPDANRISYQDKCYLSKPDLRLTSQAVWVDLKREGGEMETVIARGGVVIVQGQREGRGEEARYDIQGKTVVLTGNPLLIDKDKGATRGDKLTFHLGDGRIVIENKERERSATVIKS